MTESSGTGPLGGGSRTGPATPGLRVVMDARPIQEPDRAPLTAAYLAALLGAYDDVPIPGESFAFLLRSDLDDTTTTYSHLDVVGRRLMPPTRVFRSGALTIDPFLLRGASLGAAWRADRAGAAGSVYHMAGSGPLPIAPGLPVVATLLDLAPWELPEAFARSVTSRFGQRLRGQLLREASAVIVSTPAIARAARRLIHLHPERIHVVGLAPRPVVTASTAEAGDTDVEALRTRLGLPARFLVYAGRYDVRQDLPSLLGAIASLAADGRPTDLPEDVPWPPRILVTGASPDDRASIARAAARVGVGDVFTYGQQLSPSAVASLIRAARAVVIPVHSDATGLGCARCDRRRNPDRGVVGRGAHGHRRHGRDPRRSARCRASGGRLAGHLVRGSRPRIARGRRQGANGLGSAVVGRCRRGDSCGLRGCGHAPGLIRQDRRTGPDRESYGVGVGVADGVEPAGGVFEPFLKVTGDPSGITWTKV